MKRVPLKRFVGMPKPKKRLSPSNPVKKAKRKAKYAAHLRSPYFRALRLQAFERDGWQCRGTLTGAVVSVAIRCPYVDETRTGRGLTAHHTTYKNFGAETVDQLVTLCADCHEFHHALQGKRVGR